MATRRLRIKAVTNIPQRRKRPDAPDAEEQADASTKIEQKGEQEKPNLTSELEIAHDEKRPESEPAARDDDSAPQGGAPEPAANCTEAPEPAANCTEPLEPPISAEEPQVEETPSEEQAGQDEGNKVASTPKKPPMPARRRFIKPVVLANAINRKRREANNEEDADQKPAKKSDKIVILNEIITHADFSQATVPNGEQDKSEESGVFGAEAQNGVPTQSPQNNVKTNSVERDIKRLVPSNIPLYGSDTEYPVPPPSPSKSNRSRIKAVPKFGQRHASFSASESEDESRRNYRQRNDSICSATSGLQDNSLPSECPSPQKPKEFNSVIQRKCRRTEQSRKFSEARRGFFMKFGNQKPDRQKLTMLDLLFYNPTTNLMSHQAKPKKTNRGADEQAANGDEVAANGEEATNNDEEAANNGEEEPPRSGSDEENEMPAPQIKLDANGEIILDEQSLVIENKAVQKSRERMMQSTVINGNLETGYGVYKRAKRSKDWTKQETLKFYKALNTIGTDFTLMCEFFPRRSRRELKMKFKKEERVNKTLIDRAVMQPCSFDFNEFKHQVDMEEKELAELEKQKERELQMKKENTRKRKAGVFSRQEKCAKTARIEKPKEKKPENRSRKRPFDIMHALEESDADVSEVESDDDTEDKILQNMQKPTRSGRVPKILDRYKSPAATPVEESPKPVKTEPGSLMVVASTGTKGEPVYKVFMVTGEQDKQQAISNQGITALSKAIQYNNGKGMLNGNSIQNIFTLTTSVAGGENGPIESSVAIPAENNVTIPAEDNATLPAENTITVPAENNVTIPAEDKMDVPVENCAESNVTIPAENATVPSSVDMKNSSENDAVMAENAVAPLENIACTDSAALFSGSAFAESCGAVSENIASPAESNFGDI